MVPMRDGIKLATDVYLPAVVPGKQQERLPVILSRIPYNKDVAKRAGNYFASHGYAFVAQDTRGRYGSEGVWKFLTDDGVDGKDCAAWIGKQPWSNGRIGMLGTSYVGGTQHTMALADVPELATVIPVDAASNMGRQGMRNAGAFEMRFWNWIMLKAGWAVCSKKIRPWPRNSKRWLRTAPPTCRNCLCAVGRLLCVSLPSMRTGWWRR